jgi:hypothetical protein
MHSQATCLRLQNTQATYKEYIMEKKYVVYYDTNVYGSRLNNKAGKEFKEHVEKVLDSANVIWVAGNHTAVHTLA